jgi:hypothetical protein
VPRIVWEGSKKGEYSRKDNEILLPTEAKFRDRLPLVLGHEVSHMRLGHDSLYISPMAELLEERDAWMDSLRRMAPEEVDPDFVNSCVGTYVLEIRKDYGSDSKQFEEAKKIRRELVSLARLKRRYGR